MKNDKGVEAEINTDVGDEILPPSRKRIESKYILDSLMYYTES